MNMGQATHSRGPYAATRALRDAIVRIVNVDFAAHAMSTRQVFYQCVSNGACANTARAYDQIQRALVALRRDGSIAHDRIVDRTRRKHVVSTWGGAADILDACVHGYRRDRWRSQRDVVHIALEKQALEGIFQRIVDEYAVPLYVARGYPSESYLYEWANDIQAATHAEHDVYIYYFGDCDPTGLDIDRAIQGGLRAFGARFHFDRAGLYLSDIREHGLISVPVKPTDSRAAAYADFTGAAHGAELDALSPPELERRVRACIARHVDADAWRQDAAVEAAERDSLADITRAWSDALGRST